MPLGAVAQRCEKARNAFNDRAMDETPLPYLDAFPLASDTDWQSRVEAVLKGKSASSLVGKTYDGVAVDPLYPAAAQTTPAPFGPRGWSVIQRIDDPDTAAANAQALEDLGNGADGVQLVLANSMGGNGAGLASDAPLEALLSGVVLDAEVPIEIDSLDDGAFAMRLADFVTGQKSDVGATRISFGIDPFGAQARGGTPIETSAMTGRVSDLASRGFAGPFLVADARLIHAAGGSEAQELGYALSAALACVRMLESAGVPLEQARGFVSFRVAVDADEFLGVAKLRALRRLWASVEEQCGLAPAPAVIHAETAWRMMTRRDPDVNMLRATLAVFAAAVGGANRITVLPHTQALTLPDAFARRVARNTQLVLREEANLDKVSDPAAGSGGFETLTTTLCEKGWDEFRRIEAAGGLQKALAGNSFRSAVADVAAARAKNVARRRDGITGVTEFPALGEASPPEPRATSVDGPFAPHRLAEPFEALRDLSDAQLAKTGARPKIYLATLGSVAAFTPRATFAKNLFEAGGFETVALDGEDTPEGHSAAFQKAGATIACLCSSDALYAEKADAIAQALAQAGATRIILAGRPADEASLRAAGVTDFAFAGGDVLALLQSLAASR